MLELFRNTSPEKYYDYLQLWKEKLDCKFIETVLSNYHEYSGEFLNKRAAYLRDAFEPEELKSLLDNMKAKYIEYIEQLFSVNYTRFYIEQKCNHADDDFIDDEFGY